VTAPRFVFQSRIRFIDTDASGRIHYAAMFRHFEMAEDEFLRHIGCSYRSIEGRRIAYPRVHVEADYQAALRYDDVIDIDVGVERIGHCSFTLDFRALLDGRPAAKGKIVIAAMDHDTQRACPLPAQLGDCLRPYLRSP
jgi:YbgC/YbaW family acyl-CoA thioester hydrolase